MQAETASAQGKTTFCDIDINNKKKEKRARKSRRDDVKNSRKRVSFLMYCLPLTLSWHWSCRERVVYINFSPCTDILIS